MKYLKEDFRVSIIYGGIVGLLLALGFALTVTIMGLIIDAIRHL